MSPLGLRLLGVLRERTAFIWILMVCWFGLVGYRAWGELESSPAVHGIHRDYLPPYQHRLGWVLDPRENPIMAEVVRRYAPEKSALFATLKADTHQNTLETLGLKYDLNTDHLGSASPPHLRLDTQGGQDHIFLGQFGLQFLLFFPELGVILADALPPAQQQIRLVEAVEAPW